MTHEAAAPGRRKFNLLLAIGIFFFPIIFVWFLLRRGHSTTARIMGFVWTVLWLAIGVAGNSGTTGYQRSPTAVEQQENQITDEQRAAQAAAREQQELQRRLERAPEAFLSLEGASADRGGFDTVFLLNGNIRNTAQVDIKDPTIACELYASSGTRLGGVRETLFEIIPAQGSKRFAELNMGFMGSSQVNSYTCEIVDAELVR